MHLKISKFSGKEPYVGDSLHPVKILSICRIVCAAEDTFEIVSMHEFR